MLKRPVKQLPPTKYQVIQENGGNLSKSTSRQFQSLSYGLMIIIKF
jgi:hypothetical protein